MTGSVFFIPGSSHPGVAAPRSKPGLATAREFVAGEENALLHYVAENLLGARTSPSLPMVRRSAHGDPLSTDLWNLSSLSVSETSRPIGCRPIVLYGPSGTGKSLLAHNLAAQNLAAQHPSAIQHSPATPFNSASQNTAAARKPASPARSSTALYSGADFVRAVVDAIDTDRVAEFRRKLRQTEFILIDGLEELLSSAVTQQELAHLLDACGDQHDDVENRMDPQPQAATTASRSYGFGTQWVLTSRELPVEITSLDRRLASRLMNGLDRKSTRLNSSHIPLSRMPSSA